MRTTLTLDDDVAAMLQRRARVTRLPFKQIVNDAIRSGLQPRLADQPSLPRESDDLGTGLDAQLGVRVREVGLHRGVGDDESLGDQHVPDAVRSPQRRPQQDGEQRRRPTANRPRRGPRR